MSANTINTKHTPGPWKYEMPSHAQKQVGSNVIALYTGAERYPDWFMELRPLNSRDDYATEVEANAKLIAAAPELLEALKKVQFLLNTERPSNATLDARKILSEAIQKATE